jgi:S1-C subfamily serine protease
LIILGLAVFFTAAAHGEESGSFSVGPTLMQSTLKIEGSSSVGSGFVLLHPNQSAGPGKATAVLITAAHVLESMTSDVATIHFRKKSASGFERLARTVQMRRDGKPLWVRHPGADVAAMRLPIPEDANLRISGPLSTALLARDDELEKYEVHPGDELLVVGFPFGAEANDAGFPILRSGRIASFPLLPTSETKTFLLDFEVFKGNSGGPVVLFDKNRVYGGSTHIGQLRMIVGLVSKEREFKEHVKSIGETSVRHHKLALAVIVHASLIRETIGMLFPEDPVGVPENGES